MSGIGVSMAKFYQLPRHVPGIIEKLPWIT